MIPLERHAWPMELLAGMEVRLLLGGASIAATVLLLLARRKPKQPLPPGPKPLPLIGNVFDIPLKEPWKVWSEWSKTHGDIIYLNAFGTQLVILNSLDAVKDLLVHRAPNFSDRGFSPALDMTHLPRWSFPVMNYGRTWRDHRRVFHQLLNMSQVHKYHPVIQEEVSKLLPNILQNPKDFLTHTRYTLGAMIMRISYGVRDSAYNKDLVDAVEVFTGTVAELTAPGRLLVSIFTQLRHVPAWFPGAGWKRRLHSLAALGDELLARPWKHAKERAEAGEQAEYASMAPQLIEQLSREKSTSSAYEDEVARNVCAISYVAGADTTMGSATALYLALAMHPEVQRKAQAELDAAIGPLRLPTLKDIERLPYIQAIRKETGRWHNVLPLCLPHVATEDEIYKGYLIPAKTIIMPNTWAIMHNPAVFDEPMVFKPERYLTADGTQLDTSVLDPEAGAFGYGRRICPGRHLSNDSLSLLLASILACFDIKPAKDAEGRPVPLDLKVDTLSIIMTPVAFECEIVPRSEKHAAMVSALKDVL